MKIQIYAPWVLLYTDRGKRIPNQINLVVQQAVEDKWRVNVEATVIASTEYDIQQEQCHLQDDGLYFLHKKISDQIISQEPADPEMPHLYYVTFKTRIDI